MRIPSSFLRWCAITGFVIGLCISGCSNDSAKPQAANAGAETTTTANQPIVANVAPVTTETTVSSETIEKSLSAAQTYLDSQDIAKTQAILITLLDRAPNEFRAREMLGQSFVISATQAQQRGDETLATEYRAAAYEQYRLVASASEESAELQHSAGLMAMQAGDSAAALKHFQRATQLDASAAKYPLYEAQVLIGMVRLDEAETALQQALKLDPDEAHAHASLAMIALEQKRFDDAFMHISRARDIQPTDLGLRVQQARIHRRQGQPQRALELLIGLSESERTSEFVTFEIAAAYAALDRHADAAIAWQHVYRANPSVPNAWQHAVRAGECWLSAGKREDALFWLEQAKQAAPNATQVKALQAAIDSAAARP